MGIFGICGLTYSLSNLKKVSKTSYIFNIYDIYYNIKVKGDDVIGEVWKDIVIEKKGILYDFTGLYEVSNLGRVRSLNYNKTGQVKILQIPTRRKYLIVGLCKQGKTQQFLVHRLVATAFIPNPNNYTEVNHINENKHDNRVENLEWLPHKKNMNHGTWRQRMAKSKGRKVRCIETGQVFGSVKEAEQWIGIRSGITNCLAGKNKTAGGYTWEYVD